jgi:hypothetical protein
MLVMTVQHSERFHTKALSGVVWIPLQSVNLLAIMYQDNQHCLIVIPALNTAKNYLDLLLAMEMEEGYWSVYMVPWRSESQYLFHI